MSIIRIKICGIASIRDMEFLVQAGADAMGLVFVPNTPRYLSISQAEKIIQACPPFLTKVGLFVNSEEKIVWEHLEKLSLDALQFHGSEDYETNDFCKKFKKPFIKTLKIKAGQKIQEIEKSCEKYPDASAILLDTDHLKLSGGTGVSFDWGLFPKDKNKDQKFILAGGLNPENINLALSLTEPYAVDVSSGVESSPGIKDLEKIKLFCERVRSK